MRNVEKSAETLEEGIVNLFEAAALDYRGITLTGTDEEERNERYDKFLAGLTYKMGKKYIKIITDNRSVFGFIVREDDGKFKKGDILKPAGWAAPAKNRARGNILDGNYAIQWTGPLYL
jgi:hypothetical protein